MNIQNAKEHKTYTILAIHLPKQTILRLQHIGIYLGAHMQIERLGKRGKPSILLVSGNFYMMRANDLAQFEIEEV